MLSGYFRHNIFVSHAWKHDEDYDRIIKYLNAANDFSYLNYSVPRSDYNHIEDENINNLKEALRHQIFPADVILVLSGMYAKDPEWIQFEINVAQFHKKPIVGIKPWISNEIPETIRENANEIAGWDTPSIVYAILKCIK